MATDPPLRIAKFRWRRAVLAVAAGALVIVLIAREFNQWRQFQWGEFWRYARSISLWPVLAAIAAIYAAYAVRAARWRALAGLSDASALRLFSPTIIGFTAMALLGRAGELVRPWLISSREQLTLESQMLVWVVERLFDTAAAIILVGAGLLAASRTYPHVAAFRIVGALGVAAVAAGAVVITVLARRTNARETKLAESERSGVRRFLAKRAQRLADAALVLRSASVLITSTVLSFAMWLLVAAAYFAVLHSFRVETARLPFSDVLILMGFSLAGSLIPLPAAAGQQLAVVAALVAVFSLPSDLAVSCAILLWLATWMSVVPVGLVLLHRERLTLRSLAARRGLS